MAPLRSSVTPRRTYSTEAACRLPAEAGGSKISMIAEHMPHLIFQRGNIEPAESFSSRIYCIYGWTRPDQAGLWKHRIIGLMNSRRSFGMHCKRCSRTLPLRLGQIPFLGFKALKLGIRLSFRGRWVETILFEHLVEIRAISTGKLGGT